MTTPDLSSGVCFRRRRLLPLFFSDNTSEQNQAKRLCFRCPVQLECLEEALELQEKFGIFGGCLPSERAIILRTRKEPPPT